MDYFQKDIWWGYLRSIRDLLYTVFFFFMPFTQALTFNVGFPLKFSELTLFILAFLYLVFNRKLPLPRPVIIIFSLLFVAVSLSFLLSLLKEYPYILRTYETRFGFKGDSIARYIYFILALFSFFISVDIFLTDREKYIRFWIYGALTAGAYCLYLTVFSALHLPVFLLPGMNRPPQTINGYIIRCGTFLEGNMMGLYLILSGALCFYVKKFRAGIFLFFTVFTTFSSLSIVSVIIFLILYLQRHIFRRKYLVYLIPVFLLMSLSLILFTQTRFYQSYVYEKIFGDADRITNPGDYSKVDRVFSIRTSFRMAMAYPLTGVGLANYSRHYDHFVEQGKLTDHDFSNFLRKNEKVIPNNIYLEIFAEAGGIALVLFLLFLGWLIHYSRSDHTKALFPALICMVLCFNAYPSFIMIYLWAFMALPVADHIIRKRKLHP